MKFLDVTRKVNGKYFAQYYIRKNQDFKKLIFKTITSSRYISISKTITTSRYISISKTILTSYLLLKKVSKNTIFSKHYKKALIKLSLKF